MSSNCTSQENYVEQKLQSLAKILILEEDTQEYVRLQNSEFYTNFYSKLITGFNYSYRDAIIMRKLNV